MNPLDDALVRRLERRRLWTRWAAPTAADGERRGASVGTGMEFADHREYHEGDDLRHLDPHVYARLGRPYIKRYATDRGLDVAILLDASRSMDYGHPTKLAVAARLAAALAYVGVAAGDRVRLGVFGSGRDLRWRPAITSTGHMSALVQDLDRPRPARGQESNLRAVAAAADTALPSSGVTVVLSDWWTEDPEGAVRVFARSGRELVAVQVLAPDEEDPGMLADGLTRLVDAESGVDLDLSLDGETQAAYARGLAAWRERFRAAVEAARGRLLTVRSDRPVSDVLLSDWRKAGFVS